MGVSVRWNGTKARAILIQPKDVDVTPAEKKFFEKLRDIDADLENKSRSPAEEEFLKSMREWLDEMEEDANKGD
jgi:hypothetical protein